MPMRIVTVKLPDIIIEYLDALVRAGCFASRSEAIREALTVFIANLPRLRGGRCETQVRMILGVSDDADYNDNEKA